MNSKVDPGRGPEKTTTPLFKLRNRLVNICVLTEYLQFRPGHFLFAMFCNFHFELPLHII